MYCKSIDFFKTKHCLLKWIHWRIRCILHCPLKIDINFSIVCAWCMCVCMYMRVHGCGASVIARLWRSETILCSLLLLGELQGLEIRSPNLFITEPSFQAQLCFKLETLWCFFFLFEHMLFSFFLQLYWTVMFYAWKSTTSLPVTLRS